MKQAFNLQFLISYYNLPLYHNIIILIMSCHVCRITLTILLYEILT